MEGIDHDAFVSRKDRVNEIETEVERAFVTTPTPLTNTPRWREELGKNLRRLREERNMSVRQLAGEARMYWIELERYEDASQVPTLDRVYAIASCLDVTIHDLLPPNA